MVGQRVLIVSSFLRSPAAANCEIFDVRQLQIGRTQKEQKVVVHLFGGREPRRDSRAEEEEDADDVHGFSTGGAGEGV